MNQNRNNNLINEYISFCREQQNLLRVCINEIHIMTTRMSEILTLQLNSNYINSLTVATNNLNSAAAASNLNRSTRTSRTSRSDRLNRLNRTNRTSRSARTPPRNAFQFTPLNTPPPTYPPPPPPPTQSTNIPPPPPPPPIPPLPTIMESQNSVNRDTSNNNIDDLENGTLTSNNESNESPEETTSNVGSRSLLTSLPNFELRRRRRRTSIFSEEEIPLLPLSTRRITQPVVHSPPNVQRMTRDSRQSPRTSGWTGGSRRNRRLFTTRAPVRDRIFRFGPNSPSDNPFGTTTNLDALSPVRIRPSVSQIRRGTELVVWSDISNNYQTRCPIDMQDFTGDDSILRIRQCGHIFREMNLRRHFRSNTRCPICRFDIRDYIPPENDYSTSNETELPNTSRFLSESLMNSIDDDILNIVEEAVNNLNIDPSGNNTLFTTDIFYQFQ